MRSPRDLIKIDVEGASPCAEGGIRTLEANRDVGLSGIRAQYRANVRAFSRGFAARPLALGPGFHHHPARAGPNA
jgi:hypothetical protein